MWPQPPFHLPEKGYWCTDMYQFSQLVHTVVVVVPVVPCEMCLCNITFPVTQHYFVPYHHRHQPQWPTWTNFCLTLAPFLAVTVYITTAPQSTYTYFGAKLIIYTLHFQKKATWKVVEWHREIYNKNIQFFLIQVNRLCTHKVKCFY